MTDIIKYFNTAVDLANNCTISTVRLVLPWMASHCGMFWGPPSNRRRARTVVAAESEISLCVF